FQGIWSGSVLFFRGYPVLVAFLAGSLNHRFSDQDFLRMLVENCTANRQIGRGSNDWNFVAALLQAHGVSPFIR
ncbi:hypothetical protein ALP91_01793, partial [Pseudomonas savastanoi pv. glycinea]